MATWSASKPIREDLMLNILIADDHVLLRRGVRALLEEHAGWQVCGEASNGSEAVALAEKLRPQVAVLDLSMPDMNGIEATRHIRRSLPGTEVLVFTMHESEDLAAEVLAAGARGYIMKCDAERDLIGAVEALAQHTPFFTRRVTEAVLRRFSQGRPVHEASSPLLTSRERQIVQLIAEGKRTRGIAVKLGISVKTVETHRSSIMRKLHLASLADLVRYAVRNHFVQA
jgi:DNA-binding NarL/FixJ family response regulator